MFPLEYTIRAMRWRQRNGLPLLGHQHEAPPMMWPRNDDYVPQERFETLEYIAPDGVEEEFSLWVDPELEQPGVPTEITHYHLLPSDVQHAFKPAYEEAVRTGAYVPPVFPALPPPSA